LSKLFVAWVLVWVFSLIVRIDFFLFLLFNRPEVSYRLLAEDL